MEKKRIYTEQDLEMHNISEPITEYYTTYATESYAEMLPRDILEQAALYAIKAHRDGKCIPHSEINQLVMQRMGWK